MPNDAWVYNGWSTIFQFFFEVSPQNSSNMHEHAREFCQPNRCQADHMRAWGLLKLNRIFFWKNIQNPNKKHTFWKILPPKRYGEILWVVPLTYHKGSSHCWKFRVSGWLRHQWCGHQGGGGSAKLKMATIFPLPKNNAGNPFINGSLNWMI